MWYQRSLNAFLLAFGIALLGLILGELGRLGELRQSVWIGLYTLGFAALATAVPVCLYSLYAGIRAWLAERRLCWWVVVPVLMLIGFVCQLLQAG